MPLSSQRAIEKEEFCFTFFKQMEKSLTNLINWINVLLWNFHFKLSSIEMRIYQDLMHNMYTSFYKHYFCFSWRYWINRNVIENVKDYISLSFFSSSCMEWAANGLRMFQFHFEILWNHLFIFINYVVHIAQNVYTCK